MDILYLEIIALSVCVLIILMPVFHWIRKRYFIGPKLTVEIVPLGIINETQNKDQNDRIWTFRINIRNDSPYAAHLPKLLLPKNFKGFDNIEDLNAGESIRSREIRIIDAEYVSHGQGLPAGIQHLKILLEYRNASKSKFFTLYKHETNSNKTFHLRPFGFQSQSAC